MKKVPGGLTPTFGTLLLQGREGVPNRKKVAKMRGFLFLLSRRGCLSLLCNGLASSLFFRRLRWLVPVSWIRCGKARRARALGRAVCSAHVPCSWKAQVVRVEVPLALACKGRARPLQPMEHCGLACSCVRLCLARNGRRWRQALVSFTALVRR